MNRAYPVAAFEMDRLPAVALKVERHFLYLAPRLPGVWLSFGFALAMGLCLLASSAAGPTAYLIGRSGAVGFLGVTVVLALLFPHGFLHSNFRNWLLWLFPFWGLFSAVWSINPEQTLHSFRLFMPTVAAGIAIGGMLDRRGASVGLALALTAYIIYSIGSGGMVGFADTGSGGDALAGVTGGKNYFGHLAANALMMTPVFLLLATGRWRGPGLAFTGATMLLAGFALYKSHATGSILAAAIAFVVMVSAVSFPRLSWQFRVVLLAAVLGMLALFLIFGQTLQDEVFAKVLRTFNKETTLTGRTVLWAYADRMIETRFWLGYGSGAFWHWMNPDAWTLWRMMGVAPMSGFNFHNTFREALIGTGAIGLALFFASNGIPYIRLAWRSLVSGDPLLAVGLGYTTYFLVRMPVESTGVGPLSVDSIILLMFLSVAMRGREVGQKRPTVEARSRRPARPAFRN
ncbi:O-antigen ligase [Sphingomonas guangdongensis]|uniref:O-antigen ligase n=1 Tax=Sphingomonas guangdongensis TaxID=1141890 RepID=A0A285QHW5_9SPHN|nr:O-antigen ligase family protein [Sphingomonas guangdongensis]SOB81074.1 O-antigen ligase [Sphingomonas guangdongensis]